MFLQKLSKRLFTFNAILNASTLRCLNVALGSAESEIIDKWKRKFANEKISEIESSIKHILDHVLEQKKVTKIQSLSFISDKYSLSNGFRS